MDGKSARLAARSAVFYALLDVGTAHRGAGSLSGEQTPRGDGEPLGIVLGSTACHPTAGLGAGGSGDSRT
jgi:hypothetical protein